MAFPTTSLLDDFNRANSGSLGANWTDSIDGFSATGWGIVSNQGQQDAINFFESSYWSAATFGPDCELYFTVRYNTTGATRLELWFRTTSPGASNSAYILCCGRSADITSWGWEKNVAGVNSAIGADFTHAALATGEKIGVEMIGTSMRSYFNSGGGWTALDTARTDSSNTGAGYIGLRGRDQGIIEDWSGGTVVTGPAVTPATAIDFSRFPRFLLAGRKTV